MCQKFKRLIAFITIVLGAGFTVLSLLEIWADFGLSQYGTTLGRLMPSLGILTLGGICLLAILKMLEEKNGKK